MREDVVRDELVVYGLLIERTVGGFRPMQRSAPWFTECAATCGVGGHDNVTHGGD
jgi:hypothetical protein